MTKASAVLLAVAGLTGCPDRSISKVDPDQKRVETKDIPVNINRDLDILFLIDKSPTMADEQASLTANFPRFMQILSQLEGGLPNVHIGVISQDIGAGGMTITGTGCSGSGDNGNLLAQARVPGCTPPNGNFISDIDNAGTRRKNYTGSLDETFSCIATLGPSGCGFEQHLGSLQKALIGNPGNAGFLRPNAYLAIIVISDEDDCTASNPKIYDPNTAFVSELGAFADFRCFEWGWECDEGTMGRTARTYTNCRPRESSPYLRHPDDLVQAIKDLKANQKHIIVSAIIGPSALTDPAVVSTMVGISAGMNNVPSVQPSCTNGTQNAFPMPRIAHFVQEFTNNTLHSLCDGDLGASLTEIAKKILEVQGNPCFEGDVDTTDADPTNPGLQLTCTVSDVVEPDGRAIETIIPACKMADATTPAADAQQPCWYVKPDPVKCEIYPTKLTLAIHPEQRTTPPDTHVIAQCVVNAD